MPTPWTYPPRHVCPSSQGSISEQAVFTVPSPSQLLGMHTGCHLAAPTTSTPTSGRGDNAAVHPLSFLHSLRLVTQRYKWSVTVQERLTLSLVLLLAQSHTHLSFRFLAASLPGLGICCADLEFQVTACTPWGTWCLGFPLPQRWCTHLCVRGGHHAGTWAEVGWDVSSVLCALSFLASSLSPLCC